MKTKITQSIVANMQATAKDLVLYDDSLPGFCLRIRPTGTKIWYFRYRTPGGPQRRLVLGRFPGVGAAIPGGHLKIPHPWPGQNPPPGSGGTGDDYAG